MTVADWPAHYATVARASGAYGASLQQRAAKQHSTAAVSLAKASGGSLLFGTIVNIIKSMMGAGILSLPFALQEGGAGMATALLVVTGAFSFAGFLAIGYACRVSGAKTYREAWERTVGVAPGVIDVLITLECAICCVGYVILILDYVSIGIKGLTGLKSVPGGRAGISALMTIFCLIPLSLNRDFRSLRFSSLFGNAAMLYTVLYVILECASWEGHWDFLEGANFFGPDREGIFRSTCVMTSAYMVHHSAPVFWDELAGHPAPWRAFRTAAQTSFPLVLFCYMVFALAGFARFGPDVAGNVLLNYDASVCVLLAWVTMAVMLVVSFPLQLKLVRDTMVHSLRIPAPQDTQSSQVLGVPLPWASVTTASVLAVVAAGMLFTDISRVLGFRGALLGCPISFVLPGAMLLHCPAEKHCGRWLHVLGAWLLIIFGVFAGLLGMYCALQV